MSETGDPQVTDDESVSGDASRREKATENASFDARLTENSQAIAKLGGDVKSVIDSLATLIARFTPTDQSGQTTPSAPPTNSGDTKSPGPLPHPPLNSSANPFFPSTAPTQGLDLGPSGSLPHQQSGGLNQGLGYSAQHQPSSGFIPNPQPHGNSGRQVDLKFPPFIRKNPSFWFNLVEMRFNDEGITSDTTRFWAVMQNIPPSILDLITDTISDLPLSNRYESLKKALIDRFAETTESKLERLLSPCSLGDSSPSELLHQMKALAGNEMGQGLLLKLWWRRLPEQIALAVDTEVTNRDGDAAAAKADRLYVRRRELKPTPEISSVSEDQLAAKIAAIVKQQVETHQQGRSRSRSRSPSAKPRLCYPHFKYRDECTTCRGPPCPKWEEFAKKNSLPTDYEEYKKQKASKNK